MKIPKALILNGMFCFMLVTECGDATVTPQQAGNGTGKAAIVGKVFMPDGSPASGTSVMIIDHDALPPIQGKAKRNTASRTVQTTSDGQYTFETCAAGTYAIEGRDGSGNAARLDSIVVLNPDSTTVVDGMKLDATGSLKGKILLDNDGDPSNIFVLVFGSNRFAQVGSDGTFQLNDLPCGNYVLNVVCTAEECFESLVYPVTIHSGISCDIGASLMKTRFQGRPRDITLALDSMLLEVTIQWLPDSTGGIKGYNIYRFRKSTAGTFLVAPLCMLNSNQYFFVDDALITNETFVYAIAAVDRNGKVGKKIGPFSITTPISGYRLDTISVPPGYSGSAYWDSNNNLLFVQQSNSTYDTIPDTTSFLYYAKTTFSDPYHLTIPCLRHPLFLFGTTLYCIKDVRNWVTMPDSFFIYTLENDSIRPTDHFAEDLNAVSDVLNEITTPVTKNLILASNRKQYTVHLSACAPCTVAEYDTVSTPKVFDLFERGAAININHHVDVELPCGPGCTLAKFDANDNCFLFWIENAMWVYDHDGNPLFYFSDLNATILQASINTAGQIVVAFDFFTDIQYVVFTPTATDGR